MSAGFARGGKVYVMEIECVPQECVPFPEGVIEHVNENDLTWYDWFMQAGGTPRARCREHGAMSWAMKLDTRYGNAVPSKHTLVNYAHPVIYRGRPVQVWECKPCAKWVVK